MNEIIERLQELNEWKKYSFESFLKEYPNKTLDIRMGVYSLKSELRTYILYDIYASNDYKSARNFCYELAKIVETNFYILQTKEEFYDGCNLLDMPLIASYILMSDNLEMAKKFRYLDYRKPYLYGQSETSRHWYTYKYHAENLAGYAMYCLINEDWQQIDKCIQFVSEFKDKQKNKSKHLPIHVDIWNAIRERDKTKLSSSINELIKKAHWHYNPKIDFDGYFISAPAIGYLKAAWILGIEVELKNQYIPMEMMPVQPLDDYDENKYWFYLNKAEQEWQLNYSKGLSPDINIPSIARLT